MWHPCFWDYRKNVFLNGWLIIEMRGTVTTSSQEKQYRTTQVKYEARVNTFRDKWKNYPQPYLMLPAAGGWISTEWTRSNHYTNQKTLLLQQLIWLDSKSQKCVGRHHKKFWKLEKNVKFIFFVLETQITTIFEQMCKNLGIIDISCRIGFQWTCSWNARSEGKRAKVEKLATSCRL